MSRRGFCAKIVTFMNLTGFQNQKIADGAIEKATAIDDATGNTGGDVKISRTTAIEIKSVIDFP